MFFSLSKIFWFIANPANVLLLLLCAGAALSWTRWQRHSRRLITLAAVLGLCVAILPLGGKMLLTLENRFPTLQVLPERVDGIITLGGVINPFVTKARGQVALGGFVERLTEFAALGKRYPDAKMIFTGGSGNLFRQDVKEANVLAPLLATLGLGERRVILEDRSRNTFENAEFTFELAAPKAGETWLLITSAFHMPRAVGCFRKAGWKILPYPVDFQFEGNEDMGFSFHLGIGLARLGRGIHEWLGLIFYRLSGKTPSFFPGPEI